LAEPIPFAGHIERNRVPVVMTALSAVGRRILTSFRRLSLRLDVIAQKHGGVGDCVLRTPIGHFYPDCRKSVILPQNTAGQGLRGRRFLPGASQN
jgi:hypothetical protein